jgi:translation initiation factor 1
LLAKLSEKSEGGSLKLTFLKFLRAPDFRIPSSNYLCLMAKKNKRVDVVYSTNQNFGYAFDEDEDEETLAPSEQNLKVLIDRKQRKGKSVTLVEGFVGSADDLKDLGKMLKSKCGVGGSAKDGEIIIQGEMRDKVMALLKADGYNVKRVGG